MSIADIADITSRIQQIQDQFAGPSPTATSTGAAAFADQLRAASALATTGTSPASPTSLLSTANLLAGPTGTTGATGQAVVDQARKCLGIPYLWGGTNPQQGLDCSGLVQLVFQNLGVSLPRTAAEQATQGQPVASLADARPGDLLAFGSPVHHIAIYIGHDKMIEAPHTGADVRVSSVYETPTAIRRVVPSATPTDLSLFLQRAQAGLPTDAAPTTALPR